jgi:hypothetical protein
VPAYWWKRAALPENEEQRREVDEIESFCGLTENCSKRSGLAGLVNYTARERAFEPPAWRWLSGVTSGESCVNE